MEAPVKVFTLCVGRQGRLGHITEVGHHLRQGSDVTGETRLPCQIGTSIKLYFQDQVTSISPTFEASTVGKTKSEVFEYFGYLQINGKWVDPDSEKAMDKASNNHPDVTNPLLPGMDSFSGPYILSKSEQSIVYAEFVDDEDDAEGDPRAFRISPGDFCQMLAEGAVKVKQPQHEIIKQSVSKAQAKKYNALCWSRIMHLNVSCF